MIYGNAPRDLGHFLLRPAEMMIYLYLPVKMAGIDSIRVPQRLNYMSDVLLESLRDASTSLGTLTDHYVYVTAKTMWVEGTFSGNRPGWHADGYGSNGDLNYIWYNMNPTEFAEQDFHDIPDDDFQSMVEMERQIDHTRIVTYENNTLLRLDESVVHRVNPVIESGMRTFIKISVSRHCFNLKMNSHNYLFDYDWSMHDRGEVRNMDNKDFVKDCV